MQKDVVEGASNRELCRRVLYIDTRNAIELIVEEKAAARDPEVADGNLPDLEHPLTRDVAPKDSG